MDKELDSLLKETLYLDYDFEINDDMFPGSIMEWDSLSHMNLIYNISNKYNIETSRISEIIPEIEGYIEK